LIDIPSHFACLRAVRRLALLLAFTVISACGGGGGGGGTGGAWQSGVFLSADTFAARCLAPRSGTNPATGQPYPDIGGSTLDENNFLRSHSDNTYLWYDEIFDQDPALFNDPITYFDELVTTGTTSSGQLKDKFHFTFDSEAWFQLSQSGISAGYGAQWAVLQSSPPRQLLVAYTEPNSPATDPLVNLMRGAEILFVDGVDFVNDNTQAGVDTINAAIFPAQAGELHTFTVRDLGAQNSRDITMTSANIV